MENPCEYVPLSQYKWHPGAYIPLPTCPSAYPWNPFIYTMIASFQACTFCICLELTGQVFVLFRKRKSLYFWSILIATWGTVIFSVGTIMETLTRHISTASALLNVGWVLYTPSFSLALYSRLHLLQPSQRLLKGIKYLIIANSVLFIIPTVIATTLLSLDQSATRFRVAFIVTKTEIVFTIQEAIITTTYVYLFIRFTKGSRNERRTKLTLGQLLSAELLVLATDIVLNVLLYTESFLARQTITAFTQALKLRIEFIVLNSLVDFSQSKQHQQRAFEWHGEVDVVPAQGDRKVGSNDFLTVAEPILQDIEKGAGNDISRVSK